MLAAAIIDWWKFKVPNKLTFPLIFSGWAAGPGEQLRPRTPAKAASARPCSAPFSARALMLPVYAIGGMGAGDVKMTMGFGSWIGAFFGIRPARNGAIIFWAFFAGTIVGGIIGPWHDPGARPIPSKHPERPRNRRRHVPVPGIGEIAEKANSRRPRWHRLPYGVPLCIGFIGYSDVHPQL